MFSVQWDLITLTGFAYCKRCYFRWGKISRKRWQDISRGGYLHDTTPNSFIKAYGFYFRVGVIFAKKTKTRKARKLSPRENFHVYSMLPLCKLNMTSSVLDLCKNSVIDLFSTIVFCSSCRNEDNDQSVFLQKCYMQSSFFQQMTGIPCRSL